MFTLAELKDAIKNGYLTKAEYREALLDASYNDEMGSKVTRLKTI